MEYSVWVGIDWAKQNHQVCAVGAMGDIVLERIVRHDADELRELAEQLVALGGGNPAQVIVAIETPHGTVVDTLMDRGIAVYAINPKQLDRLRDRHSPSGAKDDRRDAFVLATSLRTDQPLFRRVKCGDERINYLRELSRMCEELTADRIMLSNRLREQIHRYFPSFGELGDVHREPWLWRLFERVPTPAQARLLSRASIATILKSHRIRRWRPEQVQTLLRREQMLLAPGVAEAAKRHALQLVPRLRLVHEQLMETRKAMQELLDELSEPAASATSVAAEKNEHRDVEVLRSLPGLGTILSATMLTEAWQPLRERDYGTLRAQCGTAPVTRQSGKQRTVGMRYACNPRLRQVVHLWVLNAMQRDPRAGALYRDLRARGHNHARAARGVGDRLLKMLISMLRRGALYDGKRARLMPAPRARGATRALEPRSDRARAARGVTRARGARKKG